MPARHTSPMIALGAIVATVAIVGTPATALAKRQSSTCSTAGLATYQVRPGDTWFGIAQGASVPMTEVLAANRATVDTALHPDDIVCLPAGAVTQSSCTPSNAATYTVAAGDGWSGIAAAAGVTLGALLTANNASQDRVLHPADAVCMPPGATMPSGQATAVAAADTSASSSAGSGGPTYTVARGDSWSAIALAAEITLGALLAANDASADRVLHPGDAVRLPAGAKVPTSTAPARVRLDALPVQGPCWYADTWQAPRGGGRRHVGVDIFTQRGEYVYAVVDGTLSGRAWDQPGRRSGNAWWLTSADGRTSFFYAHLADFAPELKVGSKVRAGQIIGWVGATGNASAVHLHFEVQPNGKAVNPHPVLAAAGGCNAGTPYKQPGGWVPDAIGHD